MKKLRIAIQKSGRLHDQSIELLKQCGISIDNGKNQLKANAKNFPLEVLYLRNGDIPQYLEDGVTDIAIIGEKGEDVQALLAGSATKAAAAQTTETATQKSRRTS